MNLRKRRSSAMNEKQAKIEAVLARGRQTLEGYLRANRGVGPKAMSEKLTKRTGVAVTASEVISLRERIFETCHSVVENLSNK